MRSGSSLVIVSTRVPPEFRGMGIAAKLTKTAFEYARSQELSVTPMCSYASTFVRRHPEYRDLVG
ncbi:MAG: N-acetyltransferase [Caldilineaceae bacterium]|nr:N-acetyltransferase [Caldilineaceae bacterium]